tara:strand:+ start:660 stop:1757 length:1098 start_codon:yes stop_codon:yes gene_type:complete
MKDLTIIIPTLNEGLNVYPLYEKINAIFNEEKNIKWEIVFVDDNSSDNTRTEIEKIAKKDSRIKLIHRIGRSGLSSACIEGMRATKSNFVLVMDGDLQHDESLIPKMYKKIINENLDIVIGSRFEKFASLNLPKLRLFGTRGASFLIRTILGIRLKDPLSGFFIIKRDYLNKYINKLSGLGFKILLDIVSLNPKKIKFQELAFHFKKRSHGESKLDALVIFEFLVLLLNRWLGWLLPIRFILYCIVGITGLIINLFFLSMLYKYFLLDYKFALIMSMGIALMSNFSLNNIFTHKDRRLYGKRFFYGMISFYITCFLGALVNFSISNFIYNLSNNLWLIAPVLGGMVSAVWNYLFTSWFTWKKKNK